MSWGPAAVHGAARDSDIAAVPAIVHGEVSYGVLWDLSVPEDIGAVEQLLKACGVGFGVLSSRGKDFPGGISLFGRYSRSSRGEARESLCSSSLWRVLLQGLGRSGVEGGVWELWSHTSLALWFGLIPVSMMSQLQAS